MMLAFAGQRAEFNSQFTPPDPTQLVSTVELRRLDGGVKTPQQQRRLKHGDKMI